MKRSKLELMAIFVIATSISPFVAADWNAGMAAFESRDYRTAAAEFAEAAHDHPDYAGCYYMLGICRMQLGDLSGAITNLEKACDLEPDNQTYVIALAEAHFKIEDFDGAYSLLDGVDVTQLNEPQVTPYRLQLARAAILTDHPEVAIRIMNMQLTEFGDSNAVWRTLGQAQIALNRFDQAARSFARAFELDPTDRQCASLAIKTISMSQQLTGTTTSFTELITIAEDLASTQPSFGTFYFAAEARLAAHEFREASDWFDKALAISPDDIQALYLSAVALSQLGDFEQAKARLSRSLELQPSDDMRRRILAVLAKISESGPDPEIVEQRHLKSGSETPSQPQDQLVASFLEPLAQRESFQHRIEQLQAPSTDSRSDGMTEGSDEHAQSISVLTGNIAQIDETLEDANIALKEASTSAEAERIRQRMSQQLQARLVRLNPEDLGLTPLDVDELLVIVRSEDAAPEESPTEPPVLRAVRARDPREVPLPLRHTDVNARISAYIASVEVTQEYHNPYNEKIEAVYTFPLPHDASVNEFVMTIGERTIRGIIREREEAEQIYKEARRRGHVASLLTQERANIFTQKVANIEPHKDIEVTLSYFNTIPFRDGGYEFAFPTVIGPRFNPPDASDPVQAVPRSQPRDNSDAVHYLKPDEISSHDISLTVDVEAGMEIESLGSATHAIDVEELSPTHRRITLADDAVVPNRDFALHWQVSGDHVKTAFLTHEDERGGYFTLMIAPPKLDPARPRFPTEYVFVIDCSGSMRGEPLRVAKRATRRILERLQPEDTFQIIRFSTAATALGSRPVSATPAAIRRGLDYLSSLESGGGTMMIEGIKAALDFPHTPGNVRLVSLMTDGFIGNEAEILAAVHAKLGASHIFSFGVGSAPNRFLLERLATMGQGAAAYVTSDDSSTDQAIDAFINRLSEPVASDVAINWEDTNVYDVFPSRVLDLQSSRPIVLCGRFSGEIGTHISLSGFTGGRKVRVSVPLSADEQTSRPELANIWAHMKIADLAERSTWEKDRDPLINDIRDLALEYGLLSKYTAFLAVDSRSKTAGDHGVTVHQAVPVPVGVRYETTVEEDDTRTLAKSAGGRR